MKQHKYLNAVNNLFYYSQAKARQLLEHFGNDSQKAYENFDATMLKDLNFKPESIDKALKLRESLNVDQKWQQLLDLGIEFLGTEDYPILLKQIYDPPIALYAKGDLNFLHKTCLSIVGSRAISNYGKIICQQWIAELGRFDICLVSGYAYGTDFEVHKQALLNDLSTIAVMASGLDIIYPQYSQNFQNEMQSKALFISEYPPGVQSMNYHFPIRNRIISALSPVTLVIEAKEKSGSLITARSAVEQNREVLAVPGSILSPQSSGNNLILKRGEAAMATSVEDVLQYYPEFHYSHHPELAHLDEVGQVSGSQPAIAFEKHLKFTSEIEETIYKLLQKHNLYFDEIVLKAEIPSNDLTSLLSMMELRALIYRLQSGHWAAR